MPGHGPQGRTVLGGQAGRNPDGHPDFAHPRRAVTGPDGTQVEGFQVHLGGSLAGGDGSGSGFGRKLRGLKTTAEDLPGYVERVLRRFSAAREPGESFASWTVRASEEELS